MLPASKMPLAELPPRTSRFGSPLQFSKVHWVKLELVVEVTYLAWTEDNLLRQVSYQGQRHDKPARQVVRPIPIRRIGHQASVEVGRIEKLQGGAQRDVHF
jgi:bifunctional non-homologous end joining protein LigD